MASQDGRDAVRLDGGRDVVLAVLDVLEHDGVQTSIVELLSLAHVSTD